LRCPGLKYNIKVAASSGSRYYGRYVSWHRMIAFARFS